MRTDRIAWPNPLKRTMPQERVGPFLEALVQSPRHFLNALRAEPVKTPALCAALLVLGEVSPEEWARIMGPYCRKGP